MSQLIQTYLPNVYELGWSGDAGWGLAIWNTLYMTIVPFIVGGAIGLLLGLLLVLT
ncbi:TPA: ABC transporter permease, partial [Streptococcus pyogenes]